MRGRSGPAQSAEVLFERGFIDPLHVEETNRSGQLRQKPILIYRKLVLTGLRQHLNHSGLHRDSAESEGSTAAA